MKNNIKKKFINLLLLEINKFNKHKKDKRGCTIKYSNKLILSIIIDKFILGITWDSALALSPLRPKLWFCLSDAN